MTPEPYTLTLIDLDRTDPRLGRRVNHDSRSLRYLAPALPRTTLASKRHTSHIPVLDQGNLGSCTGNAGTKLLSYGALYDALAEGGRWPAGFSADYCEEWAVGLYSAATSIDPFDGTYLPTDTGSDGLSVAKVLKARGLISGYTHATSLDAALTALQTNAVMVGTVWRTNMFDPDGTGQIVATGNDEGGHEYVLDEIDVARQRVWMQNSWSAGWGINGRAWMTWDDLGTLLAAHGDCTVLHPVTAPAPTPTPTPASADAELRKVLAAWLDRSPWFYKDVQAAARKWLASRV